MSTLKDPATVGCNDTRLLNAAVASSTVRLGHCFQVHLSLCLHHHTNLTPIRPSVHCAVRRRRRPRWRPTGSSHSDHWYLQLLLSSSARLPPHAYARSGQQWRSQVLRTRRPSVALFAVIGMRARTTALERFQPPWRCCDSRPELNVPRCTVTRDVCPSRANCCALCPRNSAGFLGFTACFCAFSYLARRIGAPSNSYDVPEAFLTRV
ncbi:hypothetical protein EXIGLDRAFT_332824 [Exidia glandulosa HHB12029]|uniref:Uncharacterized protein n=1 Tax=Exidia glandulosa HHB12029 TaxID=1314781 RepID=A0A165LLS6_EXIGL|nr:hypothetical protein EXIGLDRAFT_332824 [Exidia glandulosa HHB12029]